MLKLRNILKFPPTHFLTDNISKNPQTICYFRGFFVCFGTNPHSPSSKTYTNTTPTEELTMKKIIAYFVSLMLILSACAKTEPDDIPETTDPTIPPLTDVLPEEVLPEESESDSENDTSAETEIDETEVENEQIADEKTDEVDDTPANDTDTDVTDTKADSDTVTDNADENDSDDDTDTEENDDSVIVMHVPREYIQVYEKLKSINENYSNFTEETAVDEDIIIEEDIAEDDGISYDTSSSVSDYSKTNTQVADVDEGDIVKTDGKYIYALSGTELVIMSADGEDSEMLSRTVVSEGKYSDMDDEFYYSKNQNALELYIFGDTLAVILSNYEWYEDYSSYSSDYSTIVEFYDVSNRTDPVRLGGFGQDGSYITSRMTDGMIYILTTHSVSYKCDRDDYSSYIPSLYDNGTQRFISADRIVYPDEPHSRSYSLICSYSMYGGVRGSEKAVLGCSDTVYMTSENLYLAADYYFNDVVDEYTERIYKVQKYVSGYRTDILKLDLTDNMTVVAAGTVDGQLLNQFSLDEYQNNLRVVTTYSASSRTVYTDEEMGFTNNVYNSSEMTSGLYILDKNLNLIGEISGLAEDERVYSVRFSGDVGYFVTFRTVDPLFAVDLSNPFEPTVTSALKIPGFSNYMHKYSDDLLFGLGQNADEETGRTNGMKLSMFDVSNPYDVSECSKLSLDIDYSVALYNHRAILISPERGIIGFPYNNGYTVFGYNDTDGFYEISRIDLSDEKWDGNSRGLYIGEYAYIVTKECTLVLDMSDFKTVKTIRYEV